MPATPYTTYIEVVNEAAKSVGHPVTTDVPGSTDEAILRMGYYANQACQELLYLANWQNLVRVHSMAVQAVVPGESERGFALPTDFERFLDDTHWNSSTQLPALGPISAQEWRWLQHAVGASGAVTRFMWRRREGLLYIKSPPTAAENLTFEYMTKNWARDADDDSEKYLMSKNGDYHTFAWNLVILLTRLKWLDNEGYDTTSAERDFKKALESYTGNDQGATVLSLVPGGGGFPYLSERNIPPSGYGD